MNIAHIFTVLQIPKDIYTLPGALSENDVPRFTKRFHADAKKRFRRLALKRHSDHGGTDQQFDTLMKAYNQSKLLRITSRSSGPSIVLGKSGLNVVNGKRWEWMKIPESGA